MRSAIGLIFFMILLTGCASDGESGSSGHGGIGVMGEPVREVMAHGFVTRVSAEKRQINIKHAPIPEMNWAPMVMDFTVADNVDLAPLKRGDKIEFVLEVDQQMNYRIKTLTVVSR